MGRGGSGLGARGTWYASENGRWHAHATSTTREHAWSRARSNASAAYSSGAHIETAFASSWPHVIARFAASGELLGDGEGQRRPSSAQSRASDELTRGSAVASSSAEAAR